MVRVLAQKLVDYLVRRLVFVRALIALEQFPDRVLGQVARYSGRVEHALVGTGGLQVVAQRGLIVAQSQIGVGGVWAVRMVFDEARYRLQRARRPLLARRGPVLQPQRGRRLVGRIVGPIALFYSGESRQRLFVVARLQVVLPLFELKALVPLGVIFKLLAKTFGCFASLFQALEPE